jgi:hypothetical protein
MRIVGRFGAKMSKKQANRRLQPAATPKLPLQIPEEQLRRAASKEAEKKRAAFVEAFKLGDDQDNERAIRAAAVILDWISGDGGDPVEGAISNGLSRFLHEVADRIWSEQEYVSWTEQERVKRLRAKGWTEEELLLAGAI